MRQKYNVSAERYMTVEPRSFKLLFSIILMIFAVSIFVVPFLSGYGTLIHLDGTPGYLDHWDIWSSKDPWTCITYSIGDIFCHQKTDRSFILNGSQMPVCVRDVGIIIGLLAVFAYLYIRNILVPKRKGITAFIILSFILMFVDWLIQFIFDLNVPFTRFVTGILAGSAATLAVSMLYDRSFAEM